MKARHSTPNNMKLASRDEKWVQLFARLEIKSILKLISTMRLPTIELTINCQWPEKAVCPSKL